jgi:hypothetical protein
MHFPNITEDEQEGKEKEEKVGLPTSEVMFQ